VTGGGVVHLRTKKKETLKIVEQEETQGCLDPACHKVVLESGVEIKGMRSDFANFKEEHKDFKDDIYNKFNVLLKSSSRIEGYLLKTNNHSIVNGE